ncbi:hypothetical protein DOTSEDRAFT_24386 [Dothistroma septosporum NZE10]|uniref:ASST-domain-containing protein n=1 Tax=Dothistroma septosporum (strain NZE10 / CBS 128990) TaxID=675120 RepID=N1PPL6_DOTSN|nr:hypothetical protein DOTSEDRAFT_24386 [Dothistroma septosporum NZE10]
MRCKWLCLQWLLSHGLFGEVSCEQDDNALMRFVSEPNLRPPIINVTRYNTSLVTPGYWFIAPYGDLGQQDPGNLFVPAQVGPHIFADDGTLIWSGAHLFPTRSICDFRLTTFQGKSALSFIVTARSSSSVYPHGAGIVLDSSYSQQRATPDLLNGTKLNMHEFDIRDNGSTTLLIHDMPIRHLEHSEHKWGFADSGFLELDLTHEQVKFEWDAAEHLDRNTSTQAQPDPNAYAAWDWLHLNSVDRNAAGDYLLSARYTNAIYKVSGHDGSILWQLGGSHATHRRVGFNFGRQHDARFVEENATTTVISFLDNASDMVNMTSIMNSSALYVALDHSSKTARVIKRWYRPDGQLSTFRGNIQTLLDSNVFVGWGSTNNYMTEHSFNGDLLMEARFLSDRISTYRAYKYFNFSGTPLYPPSLKAFVYCSADTATTAFYVSWNGATEVASWRFYAVGKSANAGRPRANSTLLGHIPKTSFETAFVWSGAATHVFAEAVSADDRSLRNSSVELSAITETGGVQMNGSAVRHKAVDNKSPVRLSDAIDRDWLWTRTTASIQPVLLLFVGFSLSYLFRMIRAQHWHRRSRYKCG